MADEDKIGRPWSDDELDAIVADYFDMLGDELAKRPYVKSHHSAALMARIGRTHRSVEFKHQNISAVLEELGMPWIPGYKPKRNYQNAIFDGIDRYLSGHGELALAVAAPVAAISDAEIFVETPLRADEAEQPAGLKRLIRKFDPVAREFRNRSLGKAGEAFVLDIERQRLIKSGRPDLARNIRWISSEEGDGAGYDILSFDATGSERLIEVKTTNGAARTPFFLTRNEHETTIARPDCWRLYRVHLFALAPRIFALTPPLESAVHLRTETWRASWS